MAALENNDPGKLLQVTDVSKIGGKKENKPGGLLHIGVHYLNSNLGGLSPTAASHSIKISWHLLFPL